jgi:hydrophobic/amphiphilic exporter-1 (mainly G- bacteria), HAE1 family
MVQSVRRCRARASCFEVCSQIYSYTSIGGQTGSVDEGTIYVRLKPKHERERSQNDVAAGLRAELSRLAGATASITTSGFGDQKQILIQVMGRDSRELQKVADQVLALVQNAWRG